MSKKIIGGFMSKRSVFVLGDSISIHYGPYLKYFLGDRFIYDRKRGIHHALKDLDNPVGANGGDSRQVLEYLEEESGLGTKYDILLVNCGLHDIRRHLDQTGIQVPIHEYASNLADIVRIGRQMSEKLVWVDTTPVIDEIHNSRSEKMHRFSSDLTLYRSLAYWIMEEEGIPVINLYDFTEEFGEDAFIDHVHFTESVRKKQAQFIKDELLGVINGK